MRRFSRLLLLAGLACAGLALPPAALAEAPPVRLMAPRAGTTLAAGSTAELEWAPLGSFQQLSKAEEWEAFLSLDGGATYPVRITPHLDEDLRRIRFQVPPVPTTDARILLRFGDERRETAVELPQRFSIAPSFTPGTLERFLAFAGVAPSRGEAALPGGPGVVAWVEGSRRGGGLRQRIAADQPGLDPWFETAGRASEPAVLAAGQAPLPVPEPTRGGAALPRITSRRTLADPGAAPLLAFDILLLTRRQNE
jgi:hypothetical protein